MPPSTFASMLLLLSSLAMARYYHLFTIHYSTTPTYQFNEQALGALCVIDRKARALTGPQAEALKALARLTVNQLELRSRTIQLQETQNQLQVYYFPYKRIQKRVLILF